MTIHPIRRALLSTREQLVDALQIPFSEEQLDAITAPLEPAVVIAGAGGAAEAGGAGATTAGTYPATRTTSWPAGERIQSM